MIEIAAAEPEPEQPPEQPPEEPPEEPPDGSGAASTQNVHGSSASALCAQPPEAPTPAPKKRGRPRKNPAPPPQPAPEPEPPQPAPQPKVKAKPPPKPKPRERVPRETIQTKSALMPPQESQDPLARLSSTDLVAELLVRRAQNERHRQRDMYRSWLA